MKTDIVKVSTTTNVLNTNITSQLQDLWSYLNFLNENHTEEEQDYEEYRAALKSATIIALDGKIYWDRRKETLPENPEESWNVDTKKKFTAIVNEFESFSNLSLEKNIEIAKNYLHRLNRDAARAAVSFIQRAYTFKFRKANKFNKQACHLVFPNAPDLQCTLTYKRTGNVFSYELETTSARFTDGVNFFEIDTNGDLIKIKDPTYKSKGEILCNMHIIGSLDFSKFPDEKPTATFEVMIKSNCMEYGGPLTGPEIIKIETIQRDSKTAYQRGNFSPDKLILDFQIYNVKLGILIKKIIETKKDPGLQFTGIIQLFNLVIMEGFWLKNRIFSHINEKNQKTHVAIFHKNVDLSRFILNTFDSRNNDIDELSILPRDEFKSVFSLLDKKQILTLHIIFQSSFISEILKAAENIKLNPSFNGIDERLVGAIASIVCHAIETMKSSIQSIIETTYVAEIEDTIENENFFFQKFLLNTLQNTLPDNPFRLNIINPKILAGFLSKIETTSNREADNNDRSIAMFQESNMQIGNLIETLFMTDPKNKNYQLTILFVFINKLKASFESKAKLMPTNYFEVKFGRITDEIIAIFYQLSDTQISKLLRIFHEPFDSGQQFLAIKKSALSYRSRLGQDSQSKEYLAKIFYKTLGAITTALSVVARLKQIEILTFKKGSSSELKREKTDHYGSEILGKYIEDNPFKNDSSKFAGLSQFLGSETEDNKEEILTQLEKHIPEDQVDIQLVEAIIPNVKRTPVCCANLKWSKRMALLETNPFTKGINDGLMLHFLFHQLFKLDPKQNLANFLPVFDIIGGSIGAFIGYRKILNPNKTMNAFERIWESATDGGLMFEFGLALIINLYEYDNPKEGNVSDKQFFTQFLPGPFALFLVYSTWHSISPKVKEKLFPLDSGRHAIEKVINIAWRTFFYSGVCSIASLTLFNTPVGDLVSALLIPGGVGLTLAVTPPIVDLIIYKLNTKKESAIMVKTPTANTANVAITYLMAGNFLVLLGFELYNQFTAENPSEIQIASAVIQSSFWSGVIAFGTYTVCRNLLSFPRLYMGDPEIIIRKVKKDTATIDDEEGSITNLNISNNQYERLKELAAISGNDNREEEPLLNEIQHKKNLTFTYDKKGSHTKNDKENNVDPSARHKQWCDII